MGAYVDMRDDQGINVSTGESALQKPGQQEKKRKKKKKGIEIHVGMRPPDEMVGNPSKAAAAAKNWKDNGCSPKQNAPSSNINVSFGPIGPGPCAMRCLHKFTN